MSKFVVHLETTTHVRREVNAADPQAAIDAALAWCKDEGMDDYRATLVTGIVGDEAWSEYDAGLAAYDRIKAGEATGEH